jgi:hypothetical protein
LAITSVGSTLLRVVGQQGLASLRHDQHGAGHHEHRHEGEQDVGQPPITGPLRAVFSSLADITRWNTSCCGMLPSIIVMAAAKKNTMSWKLGSGQKRHRSLRGHLVQHLVAGAAGQVGQNTGDDQHAHHQHDHLHEIGPGHRHMPPKTV